MRQNRAPEKVFRCVLCTLGPSCILALLNLSQGGTNYRKKFDIIYLKLFTSNHFFQPSFCKGGVEGVV